MITRLPYSSHIMPATIAQDMVVISQMGPMIAEGPTKLKVSRQTSLVGSALPRANRVRDKETHGMASSWQFLGPHREDLASSNSVSLSQPGGFLHAPPCGLASSRLSFPARDYLRKSCKTN
jgi:hypothetical protein